jgi:hypothetical protein
VSNGTYRILGRVINEQTNQGIGNLRVEAWDKDLIFDDLVGSTTTNEQGAFRIDFEASYFQEIFADRRPDLFFKILRMGTLLESTEDSILWNIAAGETEVIIPVSLGEVSMFRKVVDLSARSRILRDEPFYVHFWEATPEGLVAFLKNPRDELRRMGINLPDDCRIETRIENHDWLTQSTKGLTAADGTIVCNIGTGNVAKNYYHISLYAHNEDTVGVFEKALLHSPDEEERQMNLEQRPPEQL